MLWKKHGNMDWRLFVLLLFGSIVLVIALVFALSSLAGVRNNADEIKNSIENTIQLTTPEEVEASYIQTMADLRAYIEEGHSSEEMFERTEEVFLSVRVPTDRRERHLETLLAAERIKAEGLTNEAVRDRLLELLQEL